MKNWKLILLILLLGLMVRVPFMSGKGCPGDIAWWVLWGKYASDHGVVEMYDNVKCDYAPAFMYVLKLLHNTFARFSPPERDLTREGMTYDQIIKICYDPGFLRIIYKIPSVVADLITGLILFLLVLRLKDRRWAAIITSIYIFNPIIIYDSAYWGQIDTIYTMFALASVWAAMERKWWLTGIIFALALTKLQAIVISPLLFAIIVKKGGRDAIAKAGMGLVLAFAAIFMPFLIKGRMDIITRVYMGLVGSYPFRIMYAHNLWWLIEGGKSWAHYDTSFVGGLIQAKLLGFVLLGTSVMAIFTALLCKKELLWEDTLISGAALVFSFYCLATQMHDRYLFMAFIFLATLIIYNRKMLWVYIVTSLGFLFTMIITIFLTYPDQRNFLWPGDTGQIIIGSIVSVMNIIILVFLIIRLAKKDWIPYVAAAIVLVLGFAYGIYSCKSLGKEPIPITKISPTKINQDFGELQINRNADGNRMWIGGMSFKNGMGVRATSKVLYVLPKGRFSYVAGYCGRDDRIGGLSNKMRFSIWDDNNNMLFDSGDLQGILYPRYFNVDIRGKERIWFLLNEGGDGKAKDNGNWANVILYP